MWKHVRLLSLSITKNKNKYYISQDFNQDRENLNEEINSTKNKKSKGWKELPKIRGQQSKKPL